MDISFITPQPSKNYVFEFPRTYKKYIFLLNKNQTQATLEPQKDNYSDISQVRVYVKETGDVRTLNKLGTSETLIFGFLYLCFLFMYLFMSPFTRLKVP